jgi:hypothetical protein
MHSRQHERRDEERRGRRSLLLLGGRRRRRFFSVLHFAFGWTLSLSLSLSLSRLTSIWLPPRMTTTRHTASPGLSSGHASSTCDRTCFLRRLMMQWCKAIAREECLFSLLFSFGWFRCTLLLLLLSRLVKCSTSILFLRTLEGTLGVDHEVAPSQTNIPRAGPARGEKDHTRWVRASARCYLRHPFFPPPLNPTLLLLPSEVPTKDFLKIKRALFSTAVL